MKAVTIWMPLYIGDHLAETVRLTTEQQGAYLLLMMDYWRTDTLPDDNAVLAQIAKLSATKWRKHRPAIEALFTIVDEKWTHYRLDNEKSKALKNTNNKSNAGRLGAATRWSPKADAMAQASQGDAPSPSSSPKEKPLAGSSLKAEASGMGDADDDF